MAKKNKKGSILALSVRSLVTAPLALVGGWIAYSNLAINHDMWLPKAIDADRQTFASNTAGDLSYYVSRQAEGRPLALIHSINAAGSSYEMRPLFEHYRATRPVYALDLPGFGFSERSDRVYTPELYQDAILEFLESQAGEPADVVALSLGGEFVARAAVAQPSRIRSLALISPSGFGERRREQGERSETLYEIFSFPLWARPFYDLIATRLSIQYFLSLSFEGPVNKGLAEYAYITAHQLGAEYAPFYFISGKLFTPDVRSKFYAQLSQPALVLYDRDAFVAFEMLPEFVAHRDNWRSRRIAPTKGLPQFELLDETTAALDNFWNV
jgi:pimeloyl-ACP methyl ester carboxylesterase